MNFGRGGRYSGGRFRGGRGDRGGRGGRGYDSRDMPMNTSQVDGGEVALFGYCKFYAKDGECRNGDRCKFGHNITWSSTKSQETKSQDSIKSLNVLNIESTLILSGSIDSTIKVWNLKSRSAQHIEASLQHTIPTTGPVQTIEVNRNIIMWSAEEPLPFAPEVSMSTVHCLFNPSDSVTATLKRSQELPYTHPMQVRAFQVATSGSNMFVFTAGGEGNISVWIYDATELCFKHLKMLEGHVRAVTCLVMNDSHLWSGSIDTTIRVWDINTYNCLGTITRANGGHKDVLTCMVLVPGVPENGRNREPFIASGGGDGELHLWAVNADHMYSCNHTSVIASLAVFQDTLGGEQCLIIGLIDGRILIRSCVTMSLLLSMDGAAHSNQTVWSIVTIGHSCFASAGESGALVVWKVQTPLTDRSG